MDWADRGHIRDGSSPARANDHYQRFLEDAALMESQGMRDYRFGVGWARIEPEPGQFDDSALVQYREKLLDLQARGIRPQLTLHHFTTPMWFERMGAFTRLKNVPHFLRFVEHTVRALCDRISEYITTNEPNVYATNGYFFGAWPPGEASFSRTLYVMSVLCAAHIAGYACIHRVRRELGFGDTRVAFANHLRVFVPKNPRHRLHRAVAALSERFFQGSLSLAVTAGRFRLPLRNLSAAKPCRYCHFHAINYYTRSTVSGLADGVRENAPVNHLCWEIYPPGIAECAKKRCTGCCRCRSTSRKTALATATTAAAAAICSTTCRRFATAACPWSTTITGAFATTLSGRKAKARALPRARGLCRPAPHREAQRAILRRNDPCPRRDGSGIQSLCRAVRVLGERGPQMITAEGQLFRLSADGLSDWFRVTKFGHLEPLHFGVPLAPQDPEPLDCIVIGYLVYRWQYKIDRAFIL